jgi:hypothetical protein
MFVLCVGDYEQNATQGFALVKSAFTKIPSPLLIEIPLKEEVSNVQSSNSLPISAVNEGEKRKGGSKKPVLMKRDTNRGKKQQIKKTDVNKVCELPLHLLTTFPCRFLYLFTTSHYYYFFFMHCPPALLHSSQESAGDKEKAYAEARARIFGLADCSESGPAASGSGSATPPSSGALSSQGQSGLKATKKGAAMEKKVAYRDRQAEMCDPDFVRRGPQPALSAPEFSSSGE